MRFADLLRALFSAVLPADIRRPLLRDLDEEFSGRPWSQVWQVARSLPDALGVRLRRLHLGSVRADLRHGVRALARTPWYASAAVGIIAISTAFGVTAFAIVDGALFRPLPFTEPDRIFSVSPAFGKLPPISRGYSASVAELEAWQTAIPEGIFGAAYTVDKAPFSSTESENASWITTGYLAALGVSPLIGGFTDEDFAVGQATISPALITYGLWQRRFGGDPNVIGRTFRGDRRGIRIVGILPPRFTMPGARPPEVLTPMNFARRERFSRATNNEVIVRLPAGMTPEQAAERMRVAAASLQRQWPPVTAKMHYSAGWADVIRIVPIREALTVGVGRMSWIVFAGAVVLIVLACLNVAALAAARARDRWRDLSVRRAIGARSFDVFRALSAEHALVVIAGVGAGTLLANPLLRATLDRMPPYLLLQDAEISARVLVFAAVLAATCLGFMATMATLAARGRSLQPSLTDGGAATVRGRSALLTVQIAMATVVTLGSALVVGSLIRVWNEDHGFRPTTAVVQMSTPVSATPLQIEQLLEQLSRLPGVRKLGGTTGSVLQRELVSHDFDPPNGNASRSLSGGSGVTAGYFDATGLQLLDGRFPTSAEYLAGASVVVVSATTARAYWGHESAMGRTLTSKGRDFTVIGIVSDGRYTSWDRDPVGEIYQPLASLQNPRLRSVAVVPAPGTSLSELAASFAQTCPECRVYSAKTIADTLNATIQSWRFRGWLFAGFGAIALLITATGMLGLVAMTAVRRTRDMGIRMALGATRPTVVRQIVGEQAGAVVIGFLMGGAAAVPAVRPLQSLLYKTTAHDPIMWASALVVLAGIAFVAALLPSLRASRIDLVGALKPE